ncbi:hypothetical protein BC939DRAFT_460716, partial [Gamsiella multidivaricata]|uniref:uncharacterized protein n=1 Tax=Gamsiella multidivaricata TaxID=101098 RepID=UPI00221FD5D3
MAQKIFTPIVLFNDLAPSSSSSTSSSIRHNASSDIPAAHVLPSTPHLRINSNSSSSSSTETRTELQRHTKTGEQDPQEQDRVADGHYKDYGHLGPSLQDTHMDVDEVYMDESDPGYVRLQASTTTIIEDKDDDDESRTKNPTNSSSYESHQERGLQELEDMSRSRSRIGVHAESVLKHTEDHNNHDNSNNNNSNSNNNNNN